ncbi:WSSV598 [White spot syndrome virus]|uniref:WSSV598 n=1 Tax=White spot syndrome virus TaxID=342409 RepID=A0A2I6SCN1_9VIRU|nr:WSSV598 [White spot syndrome virus]
MDITQEAGTEEDNKEEEDAKKEDQSLSVSEIVDVLTDMTLCPEG